jgi:hypothetical protein
MTESEWLTCTNPESMLLFLREWASDRNLLLFAAGCWRAAQPAVASTAERFERLAESTNGLPDDVWSEAFVAAVQAAVESAESAGCEMEAGRIFAAQQTQQCDLLRRLFVYPCSTPGLWRV